MKRTLDFCRIFSLTALAAALTIQTGCQPTEPQPGAKGPSRTTSA